MEQSTKKIILKTRDDVAAYYDLPKRTLKRYMDSHPELDKLKRKKQFSPADVALIITYLLEPVVVERTD